MTTVREQMDAAWKRREEAHDRIRAQALCWRDAVREKDKRGAAYFLKRLAESCDAAETANSEWGALFDGQMAEDRAERFAVSAMVGEGGPALRGEAL